MAYSPSNPPRLVAQGPSNGGSLWVYPSEDAPAVVAGALYFTNGAVLGMKTGDVVLAVETNNSYALSVHTVTTVSAAGVTASGYGLDNATTALSTGIISGGVLSINADPAKFDISAGSGIIVDHTADPVTVREVTWDAFAAQTLTNLATAFATDVAINSSGAVVQQPSFSNTELRDLIFLGGLDHSNQTSIRNVFSVQIPSFGAGLSVRDLARAVGDLNLSGNVYTAASTNLTIAKTAGTAFSFGRNTTTSKKDPHVIAQGAQDPITFTVLHRNGSGGGTFIPGQTDIDPDNYDDGTGTLAAVQNNKWTVQRILLFPNSNNTFVQYGSTEFNRKEDAVAAINENLFTAVPGIVTALTRGYLVVKKGATDLSDIAQAEFFTASKFGGVGEPSSVQAVSTLSDVTITSIADNDVLAYDSGTGAWVNTSSPQFTGLTMTGIADYADDAAAAGGGVVVGGVYRTASALKIRVS